MNIAYGQYIFQEPKCCCDPVKRLISPGSVIRPIVLEWLERLRFPESTSDDKFPLRPNF